MLLIEIELHVREKERLEGGGGGGGWTTHLYSRNWNNSS